MVRSAALAHVKWILSTYDFKTALDPDCYVIACRIRKHLYEVGIRFSRRPNTNSWVQVRASVEHALLESNRAADSYDAIGAEIVDAMTDTHYLRLAR